MQLYVRIFNKFCIYLQLSSNLSSAANQGAEGAAGLLGKSFGGFGHK